VGHVQIVRKLRSENKVRDESDAQVEGMAQLRACIWGFDSSKGASFSTYLWTQLHERIHQALMGKENAVHVPRREIEMRRR
jgi:DNA-directed RNA polymerase specialized sigma subunit